MPVQDFYPLITVGDLAAQRAYYERVFQAQTMFEASWFLLMGLPGKDADRPFMVAFMHPDHPSRPPGPEAFSGAGMILTMQVDDAADAHAKAAAAGAVAIYGPADEPWGQRRFMLRDPAGVMIDVVEQIQPAEGYWVRYGVAAA